MKKIIYEDCNNNANFLKDLFMKIQSFSTSELCWSISNLEFIPIDKGDYWGGIPSAEMENINNLQKKILDEHTIDITHNIFMDLLNNIKTIYEGNFATYLMGKRVNIKIFDGDIIEIRGDIENKLGI